MFTIGNADPDYLSGRARELAEEYRSRGNRSVGDVVVVDGMPLACGRAGWEPVTGHVRVSAVGEPGSVPIPRRPIWPPEDRAENAVEFTIDNGDGTLTAITSPCEGCGTSGEVTVPREGFAAWAAGDLIQVAMPGMTVDQCERLVTGTCSACWDKRLPLPGDDADMNKAVGASPAPGQASPAGPGPGAGRRGPGGGRRGRFQGTRDSRSTRQSF